MLKYPNYYNYILIAILKFINYHISKIYHLINNNLKINEDKNIIKIYKDLEELSLNINNNNNEYNK